MKHKILIGIPPARHVILGLDELSGLEELGYACSQVPYSRNKWNIGILNRVYGVILNAFKVLIQLYKQKPDILYLNSRLDKYGSLRDAFSIFVFRYFYFYSLKIVVKSHGSDLSILNKTNFLFKNIAVPILVSKVDGWLFLSEDEVENFYAAKPKAKGKAFVTFNIIDPKRSEYSEKFQEKHELPQNKFKFLYVGRMVYEKGVFAILDGITKFPNKEDCIFLMVGDGDELENLKSKAHELGISHLMKFPGFVEEVECDHFFANTDTLIFPSHDEGFAMALFKSVASGLPIITTQIRAAKDQLAAPDNCLWVDGESGDSVAKALKEIYQNNHLRDSMKANNIKLGEKFNKANVCKGMHVIFQKLYQV